MVEDIRLGIIPMIFSTGSAVGKTLLSVNMAAELAKHKYKVCIVDLDLQFSDVCNHLQLTPLKTIYDAQLAVQEKAAEFIAAEYITPYEYQNIRFSVLAAPLKLEESYNISTAAVIDIVSQLRREYDYIVLDTTATFSELNLAMMDISTIITFVGIVDFIPTIKNMKIGYDTMRSIGYERNKIRFVLNRSNSKTNIELRDVEQLLEEKFYHVLPNDFATAVKSIHKGMPLVLDAEPTDLSRGIEELVDKYTNRQQKNKEGNVPVLSWVKRFFK